MSEVEAQIEEKLGDAADGAVRRVRTLQDLYERGTPRYLIKKEVKSAFYTHSIFGKGSIDVRPIKQAQDDFNRVIRYVQNKPSSVFLLTADSMLVPDEMSGSEVGLKRKALAA